ncbi:MAG: DNA polymerase III subunit chi [Xanthobacteraceae bacterium]|jgi:DNA polymerase-3 subunit chi|nr:DNA polymerase III subunit chi [Xanthobacteraceae bacterium]
MSEVYFYHLQNQPLEKVLPQLLEKCLERGWRCVVQAQSDERVTALDQHLWTFRDDAFLAHGTDREANASEQPVLLTTTDGNPNQAKVRFFVEGASSENLEGYERAIHLFDGNDPDAVDGARTHWKSAQASGHTVTYWQQDEAGRWQQKA